MSGEEIAEEELLTLFEAARWAPSSYNNQPWRILYARRNTIHWPPFFDFVGGLQQDLGQRGRCLGGFHIQNDL